MPVEFIQVSDARKLIRESIKTPDPVKVSINAAAGLILAEDIFSLTDVPPFNQSSMDGYAINYQGWKKKETLKIAGMAQAGLAGLDPIQSDEAPCNQMDKSKILPRTSETA